MNSSETKSDQNGRETVWIQPKKLLMYFGDQAFTNRGTDYEIYSGRKYFDDGDFQKVSIKIYKQCRKAWKETDLLTSFKHDHIIKFIEAGEYILGPFQSYIVTDYFSQNVEVFVKDSDETNMKEFTSMFQQLCDSLIYIHWRRIIHGSLHPSNILICLSGAVKISDFVHASIAPSSIASIGNGYQPPEILLENEDVETSADIYSLGIVLTYIITKGKHPYGDSNDQCFNIKNMKLPNLAILPNLDPDIGFTRKQLLEVLKKMLSRVPCNRPTAEQLAKDAIFQDNQNRGLIDIIFNRNPALTIDDRFIATKHYEAHSLMELSLCKGAVIMIQEKPEGIFWKGRHLLSGKILDVPKSFLMPASNMQCQEWFFGKLDVRDTVRVLTSKGNMAGTFLVRENEDLEGNYYLSILEGKDSELCVHHYPINNYQDGTFGMSAEKRFEYLHGLVSYYQNDRTEYNLKSACPINEIFAETSTMIDDVSIPKKLLRNKTEISRGYFGEWWRGTWNGRMNVLIRKLDFIINDLEACHMKTLRHEHIIGFHSLIPEQPTWIVVESFTVKCLRDYLEEQRKCCSRLDFIDLALQIADGMAYLEKMKFVHGRLSTESVLIDDRRVCKIADYGLEPMSYTRRRLSERCQENEISSEKFTTKSDVWDFGAVLLQIFTERDPNLENATPLPDEIPDDIYKLFLACREEFPSNRPTFGVAKNVLFESYKQRAYPHDYGHEINLSLNEFESSDDGLEDLGPTDQTWHVLFDYDAENDLQLNVKKGDILSRAVHRDDGWSLVKKADGGEEGMIPTSYIGTEEEALFTDARS